MFKNLQKKIIALNTSLIAIVILITFACIYIYTYTSEISGIRSKLDNVASRPQGFINSKSQNLNNKNNINKKNEFMSSDYTVSFSIILDEEYTVISSFSFMDVPEQTIMQTLNAVKNNYTDYSTIKIDDDIWMYKISDKNNYMSQTFSEAKK